MIRKQHLFTYKGTFEGIRIYESRWMPPGAGMALPGIGIVVYAGAYSTGKNIALLRHEFGHVLQARQIGKLQFYLRVGIPSLWSAMRHRKRGHRHDDFWTETWANTLADEYFRKLTESAGIATK